MSKQDDQAPRRALPHRVDEAADPRRPRVRGPLVIAVVAVVVAAIAIVLVWNPMGLGRPGATPTPTIDPVATYLVQPGDLDAVRDDTAWQADVTVTDPDASTPAPRCLVPVLESDIEPEDTMVRTFSPVAGAAAGLLHQVETYPTIEAAEAAYDARLTQLGSCERNTAWVLAGQLFTGLADETDGVTLVLQGTEAEYHTIVISRTGARLNIVDATQAEEPLAPKALLPALAATFDRQCGDAGTCPSDAPTVEPGIPPVTDPAGYLAGVDLPRITPGAGVWGGTPVTPTVSTTGTRCEAVDLQQGGGSISQNQRTLILQDDAAAPQLFGVDEVVYAYGTPEEATAFVASLAANVDDCAGRTGTAEVARTGEIRNPGAGTVWAITRRTDQSDATARFRVAAVASGNHAIYLMANPSAEFDFTDEEWHAVALRATGRLAQLP